jgi:hypothetical protein
MSADTLIKISPIIGGTILIIICLIAILRNPAVSNSFAVLLAFGAMLFVIPALSVFNFKGLGVEFSGQAATTGQVTEQAAGINARLEDIKAGIADIEKRIAPSAASSVGAAPSPKYGANRNSTVLVVYPANPKATSLAKQMENDLLKKGYQATSVFSDYSELGDANKGPAGSVRYIYTDATAPVAASIKQVLKIDSAGLSALPDDVRSQMSADVQILLFLVLRLHMQVLQMQILQNQGLAFIGAGLSAMKSDLPSVISFIDTAKHHSLSSR